MGKKVKKADRIYDPDFSFNQKSHYSDYVRQREEYFTKNPSTVAEAYNKEVKKKPKRLVRWIRQVLVIVSVAILAIILLSVSIAMASPSGSYIKKGAANVHNFVGLLVEPTLASPTKVDLSDCSTAKEKAEKLYAIAWRNATDTQYFTAYNTGLIRMNMGGSDNYLDIDTVVKKTQKEYYYIEYHLKNSVPILDTIIGDILAKATDIITTERKYASAGSDVMLYQKVKNNEYNEKGEPQANWDATIAINTPVTKELKAPVFNSTQNGVFRLANHTVNARTISDAEVIYHEEEGYYEVTTTLDHTNPETIKDSAADIQAGTGDNNAKYNYLKVNFTVWDTGYLRTLQTVEKWSAKVVLSLNFEMETNWDCSYDRRDCKITPFSVGA